MLALSAYLCPSWNAVCEGDVLCSYAVDQGINFIDTAEAYPVPPKAEIQASPPASLSTAYAISMLCTKRCC